MSTEMGLGPELKLHFWSILPTYLITAQHQSNEMGVQTSRKCLCKTQPKAGKEMSQEDTHQRAEKYICAKKV